MYVPAARHSPTAGLLLLQKSDFPCLRWGFLSAARQVFVPLGLPGGSQPFRHKRQVEHPSARRAGPGRGEGCREHRTGLSGEKDQPQRPRDGLHTCVKGLLSPSRRGNGCCVPVTLTAHLAQIEPLKAQNCKTICLFLVKNTP